MPGRRSRKRVEQPKEWTEIVGRCFYCHEALIADQPGGHHPRHQTGIPYGLCRQAMAECVRVSAHGHPDPNCPF